MEASHYQKSVFKHLEGRGGHSAVISVAGSGKTWTAIEGLGFIPSLYTVLLSAFNTHTRDDFKAKGTAKGYKHVQYANYNGFGWGICMRNMQRKPELDEHKTENILEYVIKPDPNKLFRYKPIITRLVSLFKALNYHSEKEAVENYPDIVDRFNMEVPTERDFEEILFKTWHESMIDTAHFDFDDQKWMPLQLGMPIPAFDQVLVDEFQDTCPLEMELLLKAAEGGQFMGLGDPDQSIYSFKGANPDNFQNFINRMGAKELPLSICYRCPQRVVQAAQRIVPRIEYAPGAILGLELPIDEGDFLKRVQPGDMVICRTTDELVSYCVRGLRAGVPGKVRGRDFGDSIEYLIDKVSNRTNMPIAEFITAMTQYRMERTVQLEALRRFNEITRLEDRCGTIAAIADDCSYSDEIKKRKDMIFSDGKHNGVDYMTIHKSKGLQRKNVFILRPDLLPHPRSKGRDWMVAEERRLKYVAITRSEENLYWVYPERKKDAVHDDSF